MDNANKDVMDERLSTCTSCGEKIHDSDQFCPACGFPVKGTPEEQSRFISIRNKLPDEEQLLTEKIKVAGNVLYHLSVLTFFSGLVYFLFDVHQWPGILLAFGAPTLVYFLLANWADHTPLTCLVCGILLYFFFNIIMPELAGSKTSLLGLIVKIAIIIYLFKGLAAAQQAAKLKKKYNR